MTRFRRNSITCTLVVGLLALAACGGSNDSSSDGASDTTAPAEQAPAEQAPAEQASTDADAADDTTEAPVTTVGDVPGFSDECEAIVNFIGATGQILSGQIDAGRGRGLVDEFLSSVGDEIRADATVLAEATKALLDVIEQFGDFGTAITDPAGQAALAALENPDYDQATDNLGDYVADECQLGG